MRQATAAEAVETCKVMEPFVTEAVTACRKLVDAADQCARTGADPQPGEVHARDLKAVKLEVLKALSYALAFAQTGNGAPPTDKTYARDAMKKLCEDFGAPELFTEGR